MPLRPRIRELLCLLALLPGWATAEQRKAPPEQQQDAALVYPCFGCHGFKGHTQSRGIPALDRLDESRFMEKMHRFQNDPLSGSIMPRIASGYDESQLMRMSRYFFQN